MSTMTVSPRARLTYLTLASLRLRHARTRPRGPARFLSTTARVASSSHFSRSDFNNQPFTGVYEPGLPTGGPLDDASRVGAPKVTPRSLKQHLDQYVVGQERAKKVLSVAVYNHYQRIQELQRRDEELEELAAQQARRDLANRHPVEDEYPGQQPTQFYTPLESDTPPDPQSPRHAHSRRPLNPHVGPADPAPLHPPRSPSALNEPPTLEKSNILLLGPTGVGKTLLAKTLARALDVPFSISDCTPFTQAGYIGEDADVCVARLLAAANYDITRAERGIIVLDEIDKIATRRVTGGRDVGGEGVQQALLKIIEGTTLQIHAKPERGAPGPRHGGGGPGSGYPPNPMSGTAHTPHAGGGGAPPKGEVFNVRTDNILFIFTGAFIGLHKMVLERISHGSMGFGAEVRSRQPQDGAHETLLSNNEEDLALFRRHLPFYSSDHSADATPSSASVPEPAPSASDPTGDTPPAHAPFPDSFLYPHGAPIPLNILDLLTPPDLQQYGLIPELCGRIPIHASLTPLDLPALLRVLTEPKNSLVAQYRALFALSNITLRFTRGALVELARTSLRLGTGARGLRSVMEGVLGEAMFEAPGSGTRHVLVTREAATLAGPTVCLPRGMGGKVEEMVRREEAEWEAEWEVELARREGRGVGARVSTFEEYRNRYGEIAGGMG